MKKMTPEERWEKTCALQERFQKEVAELWDGMGAADPDCGVGVHQVPIAEMPVVFDGAGLTENGGGFQLSVRDESRQRVTLFSHTGFTYGSAYVVRCKQPLCYQPIVSDTASEEVQQYARAVGVPVMVVDGDTICPRCALQKKRVEPEPEPESETPDDGTCPECGSGPNYIANYADGERTCAQCSHVWPVPQPATTAAEGE